MANFFDNAIAYGLPASGLPPHIIIRIVSSVEAGQILLSVADNGPGLAPEQANSLQQRWARGQGSERTQGGSGLGLAIVARYAELLGATFTLSKDHETGGLCATLALQAPPAGLT